LLFHFRESKLIPNDVEQAYQLLQQLVKADENKTAIEHVAWMPRQYLHTLNFLLTLLAYIVLFVLLAVSD